MYNYFIERVRQNLHVVLAMSPIGDAFRNRLRMFPSLINCCTIDWFQVGQWTGYRHKHQMVLDETLLFRLNFLGSRKVLYKSLDQLLFKQWLIDIVNLHYIASLTLPYIVCLVPHVTYFTDFIWLLIKLISLSFSFLTFHPCHHSFPDLVTHINLPCCWLEWHYTSIWLHYITLHYGHPWPIIRRNIKENPFWPTQCLSTSWARFRQGVK